MKSASPQANSAVQHQELEAQMNSTTCGTKAGKHIQGETSKGERE